MAFGLDQKMSVFLRSPSGAWDVLHEAEIACHVFSVERNMAASGPERMELAEHGNLHFAPDYEMPETAQIELTSPDYVAGQRYTVQRGSVRRIAPFAAVIQQRADVVRAKVG